MILIVYFRVFPAHNVEDRIVRNGTEGNDADPMLNYDYLGDKVETVFLHGSLWWPIFLLFNTSTTPTFTRPTGEFCRENQQRYHRGCQKIT